MSTHSLATPASVDAFALDARRMLQERGAQVLNAIDDGVFFLNAAGHTIFVNESAVRMLGYTNREIIGRSMHELTHHHYADGSVFPVEECPILSSVTDAVHQRVGGDTFWTKGGAALPVDYTSIPIKDGRSVIGVVVTFRDIGTQQRADEADARLQRERELRAAAESAREALHASESRFRFMTEAIPVQIWTARPDGTLDYVSRRVEEFLGRPAAGILGAAWQAMVHPADLPLAVERWTSALATGTEYEVELRLRRHDGEYHSYLSRALPQRDDGGAVVRWFGSNTDIEAHRRTASGAQAGTRNEESSESGVCHPAAGAERRMLGSTVLAP
jgi:PAS domain S-box-containing protein